MTEMLIKNSPLESTPWLDPASEELYEAWKNQKKKIFENVNAAPPVAVESLQNCSRESVIELKARCAAINFGVYEIAPDGKSPEETGKALLEFAALFGLRLKEEHRSGGEDGVVALTPTSEKSKKGYIPYTPRALNWHTDGYYNLQETPIKGFILHCHTQALNGGVNEIMDPEIAYMRLRDTDPAMLAAFFHPEAMTIPENVEPNGKVRPASVGPVFFTDNKTGRLQMRYTARTRSIEWRDDPATLEAADWMRNWLNGDDEYKIRTRLKAGQGVLNNNVLHNRTGFEDDPEEGKRRVMLRVRFHDRIEEN